jgi:hypothetical protein
MKELVVFQQKLITLKTHKAHYAILITVTHAHQLAYLVAVAQPLPAIKVETKTTAHVPM